MRKAAGSQIEKGIAFRALHENAGAFIIPNPWDAGTTRILTQLGFAALATTSAGYAFSLGQQDNTIGCDAMLAHISAIVSATHLPVSGDLENGFGDAPEVVAETIRMSALMGLVGGSIEDSTGSSAEPIYEKELAVERIRAASEAAKKLAFTFTLTARCENYLVGKPDLADTIARLQSYQDAGADVLYAPGIREKRDIVTVVESLDRPVNVIMGLEGVQLSLAELSEMGVKRVSIGSALARAALGTFLRAAKEMESAGTFSFAEQAVPFGEISDMFKV